MIKEIYSLTNKEVTIVKIDQCQILNSLLKWLIFILAGFFSEKNL